MASPSETRVTTSISSASTSHAVNVGDPTADSLLIVFARFAAAPGAITFTGYTQLALDSTDASDDTTAIYYRWADGTEGATDTCSPTNSVKAGYIVWIITGAINPATQPPEVSTVAIGTTANTANPNSRAVTGGPKDVLYLAMMAQDNETLPSAAPTNYTNLVTSSSGTTGAVATNCTMAGASRQITASSSDDPGAFSHTSPANGWTAFTVVVHPAPPPQPGPVHTSTRRRAAHRFLTVR